MPEIAIGARSVPYEVRQSVRAERKRVEVTPAGVCVIVPEGTSGEDVEELVRRRRRWLHDKTEEIREEVARLRAATPQGFHSSAKIFFRGRYLKLRVRSEDVERPALRYRTAFDATLPRELPADEREPTVRGLIEEWLEERLTEDAWEIVRRRGVPHGLEPPSIRIKDQRTLWGSCGLQSPGPGRSAPRPRRSPGGCAERSLVVHGSVPEMSACAVGSLRHGGAPTGGPLELPHRSRSSRAPGSSHAIRGTRKRSSRTYSLVHNGRRMTSRAGTG